MSKTPFEIRSDLIHVASNSLMNTHGTQLEVWRTVTSKMLEGYTNQHRDLKEALKFQEELQKGLLPIPAGPTADDIAREATKLYAFVTKKD